MKNDFIKKVKFSVRNKNILGEPRFTSDGIHLVLILDTRSTWKDYPTELFEREYILALRVLPHTEPNIHYIMSNLTVRIVYAL